MVESCLKFKRDLWTVLFYMDQTVWFIMWSYQKCCKHGRQLKICLYLEYCGLSNKKVIVLISQVQDAVIDLIAEDFIETEVINPDLGEEIPNIATEVLSHYDTKVMRRELKEVYPYMFEVYGLDFKDSNNAVFVFVSQWGSALKAKSLFIFLVSIFLKYEIEWIGVQYTNQFYNLIIFYKFCLWTQRTCTRT